MSYSKDFDHDGETLRVRSKSLGDQRYEVVVGDRKHEVTATRLPDGRVRFELDGVQHFAAASRAGTSRTHVDLGDRTYLLAHHTGSAGGAHAVVGDGAIVAPMTGTVLKINVAPGDAVTADQTVAVVTAMKMEHKLTAGIDGTVAEILESEGAQVDQGTLILRVE